MNTTALTSGSGILDPRDARYSGNVSVLVVGGGGCGLTAALSAQQAGAEVLVLERDASTLGTTAMSTGLIPAAGRDFRSRHRSQDGWTDRCFDRACAG